MAHCRACFKIINEQTKTCLLEKIIKINLTEVSLGQMLSEFVGIAFGKDVICTICAKNIIKFYNFKIKVLETDKLFQSLNFSKVEEPELMPVTVKIEEVLEEKVLIPESVIIKTNDTSFSKRRQRHLDPSRKSNLEKYQRNAEGLYECPKENCPGLFKYLGRLEMHLEQKHPSTDQKTFPCKICGEEFYSLGLHKKHFMKFHIPRPYICDLCGHTFPSLYNIRSHINFHLKKPKHTKCTCSICGKLFASEGTMIRHRKEVHFPKELIPKPYICHVCGLSWATESKLKSHAMNHGDLKFICDICSKRFVTKGAISIHMQSHMLEKRFSCDVCGQTFKTRKSLQNHMVRHSDEKSFSCPKCPKKFKLKTSLHDHDRVHTMTDPVTCNICGKVMKNISMRDHLLLHNGKDLQCPHCERTYKQKDTLKWHVRTVHMGMKKRHECTICFKHLWSRDKIVDHVSESHKDVLVGNGKTAKEFVRKYWTSDPSGVNRGEIPPNDLFGRPVIS